MKWVYLSFTPPGQDMNQAAPSVCVGLSYIQWWLLSALMEWTTLKNSSPTTTDDQSALA